LVVKEVPWSWLAFVLYWLSLFCFINIILLWSGNFCSDNHYAWEDYLHLSLIRSLICHLLLIRWVFFMGLTFGIGVYWWFTWGLVYVSIQFNNGCQYMFSMKTEEYEHEGNMVDNEISEANFSELLASVIGANCGGCPVDDPRVDEVLVEMPDRATSCVPCLRWTCPDLVEATSCFQFKVTMSRFIYSSACGCWGLMNLMQVSLFYGTSSIHYKSPDDHCCSNCCRGEGSLRLLNGSGFKVSILDAEFADFVSGTEELVGACVRVTADQLDEAVSALKPSTLFERMAEASQGLSGRVNKGVEGTGTYSLMRTAADSDSENEIELSNVH